MVVRIKKPIAERFEILCMENRIPYSKVFQDAVKVYMKKHNLAYSLKDKPQPNNAKVVKV